MLNLFRKPKNEVMRLSRHLNFAFSKLDGDVAKVQQWITHLHEKNTHLERSHSTHLDVTKRELSTINKWIHHLNNHNLELQKYLKELTNHLISLQNKDTELLERIHILEKESQGHSRTLQRTSQGQVKDMSLEQKREEMPKKQEKIVSINKSTLNGAQLELLNVFYETDRPLSYKELANIVGKKEKSIRNLIYEIREKGIKVKNRFVGLRKKGFFLTKEEKIQLTGR